MLQKSQQNHNYIYLACEPCEICKKSIPLAISRKNFKPHPSGITTVIDTHGMNHSTPHYRILYVDRHYSVRSFSHVTNIATEVKK